MSDGGRRIRLKLPGRCPRPGGPDEPVGQTPRRWPDLDFVRGETPIGIRVNPVDQGHSLLIMSGAQGPERNCLLDVRRSKWSGESGDDLELGRTRSAFIEITGTDCGPKRLHYLTVCESCGCRKALACARTGGWFGAGGLGLRSRQPVRVLKSPSSNNVVAKCIASDNHSDPFARRGTERHWYGDKVG